MQHSPSSCFHLLDLWAVGSKTVKIFLYVVICRRVEWGLTFFTGPYPAPVLCLDWKQSQITRFPQDRHYPHHWRAEGDCSPVWLFSLTVWRECTSLYSRQHTVIHGSYFASLFFHRLHPFFLSVLYNCCLSDSMLWPPVRKHKIVRHLCRISYTF